MKAHLLILLLMWQPILSAQDGNLDDFNELELGDDDFSLESTPGTKPAKSGASDVSFRLEDLPNIPDEVVEDINFGENPAAKAPKEYDLNQLKTSKPAGADRKQLPPGSSPPPKLPNNASPQAMIRNNSPTANSTGNFLSEPATPQIPMMPVNSASPFETVPKLEPSNAGAMQTPPASPSPPKVESLILPEYQEDERPAESVPLPVADNIGVSPNEFPDDRPPSRVAPIAPINDFSGVPYVPGSRRVMASGEAPERYIVEEGDTLYDVCDQLLDEPEYWPKLWALNPGIKNPHFIFPGMQLSFYPGDETTPPYLEVVSEDDIIPVETGGVDEKDLLSADVGNLVVEDDQIPAVEVIQAVKGDELENIEFKTDFETFGLIFKPDIVQVDIPAFFFKEEVDILGQVVSGPYGQINAAAGDRVVIEKFSDLQLGSSFTIVRPSGLVYNKDGEEVGYRYEYVAQVQMVSGTDDGDYMIAAISRSRLGVQPQDKVISYMSTMRTFNTGGLLFSDTNSPATIIGFDYPDSMIAGEGRMVFIDGEFSSGTTMPIYQRLDERIKKMLDRDLPAISSRIGILKIIDQVGSASLGVIIKSSLDVRIGDRLSNG